MDIHNLDLGYISNCQICNSSNLSQILNLGFTPPCDSLLSIEELKKSENYYPLNLIKCEECDLLQIDYVVDPNILFHKNYPYRSGITSSLANNLMTGARKFVDKFNIQSNSLIIDIGSNDGTFLKGFKEKNMRVLGVEPTNIAKIANDDGIETVQEFFSKEVSINLKNKYGSAKIVTAANMFAHVQNLGDLIKGTENILDNDGYFITESHYSLSILDTLQFDSIYHEHLKYYSLKDLIKLFSYYNFTVIDAEKIPNYGGSIRCYAQKGKDRKQSENLINLLSEEENKKIYSNNTWIDFSKKVEIQKSKFKYFISNAINNKKSICGIGSPGRSCTLLNYYGISPNEMPYIAEQSTCLKLGLYSAGQHIPIVDEKRMFEEQPDYAVMLSWHYSDKIIENLRKKGLKSKIVIPLPEIIIID